jgi:DNA-directed RNA polymerase subunit F
MTKKEYIPIPEVYRILSGKGDLTETEAQTISYTEKFLKIKDDSSKVVKELMKKYSLKEDVAVKLVDIVPKTKEEITSILSGYGVLINEKDLNNLLDYLQELVE